MVTIQTTTRPGKHIYLVAMVRHRTVVKRSQAFPAFLYLQRYLTQSISRLARSGCSRWLEGCCTLAWYQTWPWSWDPPDCKSEEILRSGFTKLLTILWLGFGLELEDRTLVLKWTLGYSWNWRWSINLHGVDSMKRIFVLGMVLNCILVPEALVEEIAHFKFVRS